jgi:DNA-binding transcriptional ArsR family regulator
MQPLAPHGGLVDIPCWALRAGGVELLARAARAMPLWCLLHSMNGLGFRPSEASESTLADTLGVSRSTVRRLLKQLRRTANGALLLELRRPRCSGVRIPPIYRWAVNPFEIKRFVKVVCDSHLPRIAEEHGLSEKWLWDVNDQVGGHFAKARICAENLKDELLSKPCVTSIQNGKTTEGGVGGTRRRRRMKRKSRRSRR